jgi:hypothetical protein
VFALLWFFFITLYYGVCFYVCTLSPFLVLEIVTWIRVRLQKTSICEDFLSKGYISIRKTGYSSLIMWSLKRGWKQPLCWRQPGRQTPGDELFHGALWRRGRSVALSRTVRDLDAGAAPSLRTSERSAPRVQTVHDGAEGRLLRNRPRSRLPKGTSSRRR